AGGRRSDPDRAADAGARARRRGLRDPTDRAGDRRAVRVRARAGLAAGVGARSAARARARSHRARGPGAGGIARADRRSRAAGRAGRALAQVCALIDVADRAAAAALPGFAELGDMLLDRATVDFPDHVPLHTLARQRSNADPGAALERLERLAEAHRMDPRGR